LTPQNGYKLHYFLVQATSAAFAEILQDGPVVAWGDPDSVGYNGCCHRGAAHYNSME